MSTQEITALLQDIDTSDHSSNDYFTVIKKLVAQRNSYPETSEDYLFWQNEIDRLYLMVSDEIKTNLNKRFAWAAFFKFTAFPKVGKSFNSQWKTE